MGCTMAEKILMKNTGLSHLAPGDLIMTRPDMCMVHDIYTPFVVQKLDEMKFRRLADPEKAVIFLDHLCPTNQATGDPRPATTTRGMSFPIALVSASCIPGRGSLTP